MLPAENQSVRCTSPGLRHTRFTIRRRRRLRHRRRFRMRGLRVTSRRRAVSPGRRLGRDRRLHRCVRRERVAHRRRRLAIRCVPHLARDRIDDVAAVPASRSVGRRLEPPRGARSLALRAPRRQESLLLHNLLLPVGVGDNPLLNNSRPNGADRRRRPFRQQRFSLLRSLRLRLSKRSRLALEHAQL